VSPNLFIPLAEENGVIDEIGEWVIQQIVNFQQQLAVLGRSDDIKIAINVSPHQLRNPQFISIMTDVTENKLLRATGIRLEITESAAIDDFTWCAEQLTQLQKLGFDIAIDDFGTGFTSLQYLLHLPVHVIKLDRSLIQEVDSSDKSYKIISSLVGMAHATGLKVVAEGVERETQLRSMQAMQCDELQGFYLSKPMSEHSIKEVLTQDLKLDQ
jgi:EAL domain-containing protein (putative c-di-GMP-specific phosphodiesterase class I)